MFADLVKGGKLPALDQRLPVTPLVVADRQAQGVYGGELRVTMFDPVWWVSAYDLIVERLLTYSDKDGRTIVPNVLAGWEVTPDGKTYTFKLRKGMKWHTGDPITTEDVRFWWEDHMTNKDINSAPWWQFRFGGENMKVEIVDDVTFKFTFAAALRQLPGSPHPLGSRRGLHHLPQQIPQAVPSQVHRQGQAGSGCQGSQAGNLGTVV